MRRLIIVVIVCCLFVVPSRLIAQQDVQFSQYMFNSLFLNPGYAGIEGVTRVTSITRVQWLAYEGGGAPTSTILSASTKLPSNIGGIGLYLLYDKLGPIRNTDVQLSYAYHIKLKGTGVLGIGARGGIYSQKLNPDYRVVQTDDQIYQYLMNQANNGNLSQMKADLTGGIWYNSKKYYGGVSFTHIPQAKYTLGSSLINSKLVNHMYITAGYNITLNNILITPSALLQTDLRQFTYLFGALVTYNNKMWVGLNARQSLAKKDVSVGGKTLSNDDIILYIGVNVLKTKLGDALRLGYSFDFVTSGVNAKKRTSHEIMLSYMAPPPWGQPKPKVRTPRYRHEEIN